MVDTYDLFKRLAKGAVFKKNEQNHGLAVLKHKQSPKELDDKKKLATVALDFFGDNQDKNTTKQEEIKVLNHGYLLKKRKKDQIDKIHMKNAKRAKRTCDEEKEEEEEVETEVMDEGEEEVEVMDEEEEEEEVTVEDDTDGGNSEKDETDSQDTSKGIKLFSDKDTLLEDRSSRKSRKKSKQKDSVELRRQEANAFRYAHRIYVSGSDIPDAVGSFKELNECYALPPYIAKNINFIGYKEPTPIQMQAIPLLLQGREILACAPTGSGKTAAFIIPILTHLKKPKKAGFRAIVVCPTRELALQTQREFNRLSRGSGYRIHALTGATASANSFGPQSSLRFDILITTPIRLIRMLSRDPPAISVKNVEWLVLDESDKLFEDGIKGFKNQVAEIYTACDNPNIKHALFSATLTTGVEEFCRVHLDSFVRITIGRQNAAADIVEQKLLFVGQESGKLLAVRDIIHKGFTPPVLVFVQSIERAKELFHELIYDGMNVDVIHSERTQAQRDNIVNCFRAGKIWILICTDLMGRGMDFKGINLVINYDFPPTAISYIHRIGRTGRAGRPGQAITLFTEEDVFNLRSIASVMKNSGCEVPGWMLQLKKTSKQTRKRLARKPIERNRIKTASKYDLQKAKKKRDIIKASKRRKARSERDR